MGVNWINFAVVFGLDQQIPSGPKCRWVSERNLLYASNCIKVPRHQTRGWAPWTARIPTANCTASTMPRPKYLRPHSAITSSAASTLNDPNWIERHLVTNLGSNLLGQHRVIELLEKLFVVAGQIETENEGTGRQPTELCDPHIPSIPSPRDPSTGPSQWSFYGCLRH